MGRDDVDPIEDLVARYLEAESSHGRSAAEALLHTSPQGDAARRRVEELRRLGFAAARNDDPGDEGETAAPPVLQQLGPYHLLDLLGRGGMGTVHRARHREHDRIVAVKCLHGAIADDAAALERFRREAAALAGLHHPGIVGIVEFGVARGVPWYAMDHVDGPSLETIRQHAAAAFATGTPPSVQSLLTGLGVAGDAAARLVDGGWCAFCLRVVRDAARALGHAHRRGVVHRDVKPGNLMLRTCGRVVVVDFGLAAGGPESQRLTRTGEFVGSPLYAAPEHLTATAPEPQPTLDVWSLGVVLCELLTGAHPFRSADAFVAQRRAARQDLGAWRRRLRALPHDVATVCLVAIDPDPARRYPDGVALAQDLDRLLQHRQIAARRSPLAVRCARLLRRHPTAALAAVATVAVAVLALGFATAVDAFARDVEQQRRVTAELDLWGGRYSAAQVPSRTTGAEHDPRQHIRDTRRQMNDADLLAESKARMLLRFADDAYELGMPQDAESCAAESMALLQSAGIGGTLLGQALGQLALAQTLLRLDESAGTMRWAMQLLGDTQAPEDPLVLRWRLQNCRITYRAGETHAAYDMLEALLRDLPPDRADLRAIRVDTLAYYGVLKALNTRIAAGLAMVDEAIDGLQHQDLNEPGQRALAARVVAAHAHALRLANQLDASAAEFERAFTLALEAYRDPEHIEIARIHHQHALLLRRRGQLPEALTEFEAARKVLARHAQPLDGELQENAEMIGKLLRELGRYHEALPWYEARLRYHRDLAVARGHGGDGDALDPAGAGGAWLELAQVRALTGDAVGAVRDLQATARLYRSSPQPLLRHFGGGLADRELARVHRDTGRLEDAERFFRSALEDLRMSLQIEPQDYLCALDELRAMLRGGGTDAVAQAVLSRELQAVGERVAVYEAMPEDPKFGRSKLGNALRVLGELWERAENRADAAACHGRAAPMLEAVYGADHAFTRAAASGAARTER
ncbi:MAG: protein kinase [Planctomycetota bacterium]